MFRNIKKLIVDNKDSIIKAGTTVFNHKNEINLFLKDVQWEDVTNGKIVISEELINSELKKIILENGNENIK